MNGVTFKGTKPDAMAANAASAVGGLRQAIRKAVYKWALPLLAKMQAQTPIDKGPLRASLRIEGPTESGDKLSLSFVAGGPSAPYAVYVHENLRARHASGTNAKFIERPLFEAKPTALAEIGAELGGLEIGMGIRR